MKLTRRQLKKIICESLEEATRIIGTEDPSEAIPSGIAYKKGLEKARSNYKNTMRSGVDLKDFLKDPSMFGSNPVDRGDFETFNQSEEFQNLLIPGHEELTEPEKTALSMGSIKAFKPDVGHSDEYYEWSASQSLGIKDENDQRDVYKNMQELARDLAEYSISQTKAHGGVRSFLMSIEEIIENEAWRLTENVYDELDGQKMPGKNDDETLKHIKDVIVKKLYDYNLNLRLEEEFDSYYDDSY